MEIKNTFTPSKLWSDYAGCLKNVPYTLRLNFDKPIALISNFIISYDFQCLNVLFDTSLKYFSQLETELHQFFFEQPDFYRLENSLKFVYQNFTYCLLYQ